MGLANRIVGVTVAVAAALALALPQAFAQTSSAANWPQRTVKFLLPLGPGSGADISARLFADRLAKRWGQSVVVENRPGADGVVAITAFIGAADDHTLLFGPSSSFVGHPYTLEKMSYDPHELAPIAKISNTMVSIAAPASLNVGSLKELIDRARSEPGALNWATITGVTDIIVAGYAKMAGLQMNKIPYRDTVQALNDLAESRIHFYIAALAITQAQARAGRIRLLAVTNRERAPNWPDLPTVAEAGVPALSFDGLVGLYGPRTMPADLRDRIAADLKEVAVDPEIAGRLTATGQVVRPGTSAEFAAAIDEQAAQLAAFAQALGIKPKP
jgi:tripartite-type tricarboxylate transporter receptor subunit TctC